jgi:hypothetical protein
VDNRSKIAFEKERIDEDFVREVVLEEEEEDKWAITTTKKFEYQIDAIEDSLQSRGAQS